MMGLYTGNRSQPAEAQVWQHLDRMRDAGPVADYILAAHERQVWAMNDMLPSATRQRMEFRIGEIVWKCMRTCAVSIVQRVRKLLPAHPAGDIQVTPIHQSGMR